MAGPAGQLTVTGRGGLTVVRYAAPSAGHALSWDHAFCPAAPYLAAPTDLSLARLPLVTEGHFVWAAEPGAEPDLVNREEP